MFLENTINHRKNTGWIEVICGSMFSGKTEELIRRVKRAELAGQKVEIFKPAIDKRYDEQDVVSHDENKKQATPIEASSNLPILASDCDVVGIDEAQFFDEGIVEVANLLANSGKRIIIAGLDMDFKGRPFGPMPNLMAVAEYVTKVHAICVKTGNLANYSHRKIKSDKLVELGERAEYEPLSRAVFWEELRKEEEK
ncbi:thymidine kinase [Ornithobacterium rhinotracheale]|uniref:Thymidine kinase n=1 Tax=Ornithobacterium rhinotracheale (strain ATCC 51463 / DSM 15997 / CCUG 23171 / CIP 104009 / LMG 9086) TaxID=867902 RepID=I3ZZ04_ORNRL|nr:thymidine kinase [Ornithobacterium rhinotracheale]AFL96938.1 thymidine kinase [Ornithobacterium rhinotracheale DSM 15997]AIP99095.1 thymidine kinase [Ornithobacterium rhinotracheale ORT-UMN 88]KGB66993.1 thymidine kinase [Ornithobacterium rhinotracheale H06-030791]MCK0194543.1 thymidine kinase [Ornithobacterium rhinotracheale]MCK0199490.1 thymidine kinase [Ornithobacterium rhinotracheale]